MTDDRDQLVEQTIHLWLALIDGTVPTSRLAEAWAIARAIQAVYLRHAEGRYRAGLAVGRADSSRVAEPGVSDAELRDVLLRVHFDRTH